MEASRGGSDPAARAEAHRRATARAEEARRRATVRAIPPGGADRNKVSLWIATSVADEWQAVAARQGIERRLFAERALVLLLSKGDSEIENRLRYERERPSRQVGTIIAPGLARETRIAAKRFGVRIGSLAQVALEDLLAVERLL